MPKTTAPDTTDTELTLNVDEFTLGDLEDFEAATGHNLLTVVQSQADGNMPAAKALRGLLWLLRRQSDPDVTFESLRDAKLSDLTFTVPDPS